MLHWNGPELDRHNRLGSLRSHHLLAFNGSSPGSGDHPSPGLAGERSRNVFRISHQGLFASPLQIVDDGTDFGFHAALGKVALCEVLARLLQSQPVEPTLVRLVI